MGTSMGSDEEFAEMIQFVNDHKIKPVVDKVFPAYEAKAAFDRMDAGKQFGKIVITIG